MFYSYLKNNMSDFMCGDNDYETEGLKSLLDLFEIC